MTLGSPVTSLLHARPLLANKDVTSSTSHAGVGAKVPNKGQLGIRKNGGGVVVPPCST